MFDFEPDPLVQELAEAYYLDAVDTGRENWSLSLDGSENSIKLVEQVILTSLHVGMESTTPSRDKLDTFVKMFGSYVGEVYRRHHGGEWGWVASRESRFVGLRRPGGGLCWPWGRIQNRLLNGPADNVWLYYHTVMLEHPREAFDAPREEMKNDSLFRRLFGSE